MKNLDKVRDLKAQECMYSPLKDSALMALKIYKPDNYKIAQELCKLSFVEGWNECAKLKDEEWRKIVEPFIKTTRELKGQVARSFGSERVPMLNPMAEVENLILEALAEYEEGTKNESK